MAIANYKPDTTPTVTPSPVKIQPDNIESKSTQGPGAYLIKNVKTEEIYVGSSKDMNDRRRKHLYDLRHNKHHVKRLQEAFNIGQQLLFITLPVTDREQAFDLEQQLLNENKGRFELLNKGLDSRSPNKGTTLSPERVEYLKEINKGNKYCIGRKVSEETRAKMSESKIGNTNATGYKHSDEAKIKMKIAAKNRPPITDERKEKQRQIMLAREPYRHTVESKAKMSASRKGKVLTDEHRSAISAANSQPVLVNSVSYSNVNQAAKATGISVTTIRSKIARKEDGYSKL